MFIESFNRKKIKEILGEYRFFINIPLSKNKSNFITFPLILPSQINFQTFLVLAIRSTVKLQTFIK